MANLKFDNVNQALLKVEVRRNGDNCNGTITIKGNRAMIMTTLADQMERNDSFRQIILSLGKAYNEWTKKQAGKEANHEK